MEREEIKTLTRKFHAEYKPSTSTDLVGNDTTKQICRLETLLPKSNGEMRAQVQYTPKKKADKKVPLPMTVTDLCQSLKLSRSTISRMDKSGALPGRVMIGGISKVSPRNIENWLRDTVYQ